MMKKILINKFLVLLITFLGTYSILLAQEKEVPMSDISGRIVDSKGQPVSNVAVTAFIAKENAVTDANGNFTIKAAAILTDHLFVEESGYKPLLVSVENGKLSETDLVLQRESKIDGSKELSFPYQNFSANRSVSASTVIKGEELGAYPSPSFLEALSGRVPGMVVHYGQSAPGRESVGVSIRGVGATTYIDGIVRSASDLAIEEVESVHVIRDLSGRAMLGLNGTNPVIYIITKKGDKYTRKINATTSFGLSSPMAMPEYLNAFDYATLYNEARENDGLTPRYSAIALQAYKKKSDMVNFPDVNYQDEYVKKQTMYRKANVSFSGGDQKVTYFSMLDYVGTDGLEAVGQDMKYNRYKIRGNVDIKLNDWMKMNVNLSAVYGKNKYANAGGGADYFNLFDMISRYPANAHPIMYKDKLIVSSDYPMNFTNELMYGGYAENVDLNTQNSAELEIDLGSVLEGLTFKAGAAFDVYNAITNNKGGTADLYRIINSNGMVRTERIVEEQIVPNLSGGADNYMRRTSVDGLLSYDRTFDKHEITLNASYFQLMEEVRNVNRNYQPLKRQDLAFRANYAYNKKYVAQVDLSYTGSMFLQKGDRFGLYPTVGAGWIVSNEDFLADSKAINYLKLYSSYGQMAIEYVGLSGFNSYYLFETLWQRTGGWQSGIEGNRGAGVNIYNIMQPGSELFELPTLQFINFGLQTNMFENKLALEVNYYNRKESNLFSLRQHQTPSLFGGYDFLPAANYGENKYWGLDGLIQFTDKIGDFNYSIGANAMYNRGKIVKIDEPIALEDYRKRSNTEMDHFWGYTAEGLFQSESEIESRGITQSWGDVQPGDIKYADYNNDDVVDENDVHDLGVHSPRISYGVNLCMEYKGFGFKMIGTGVADGKMLKTNGRYFQIQGSTQNYSKPMLERWPVSNNYPRLTTQSVNNYQTSTFWLENAAYFTVKNIELSYTLPRVLSQKLLMNDCKLFVQGRNLFTASKLSEYGINPENQFAGIYAYPMLRTVTIGVACKF